MSSQVGCPYCAIDAVENPNFPSTSPGQMITLNFSHGISFTFTDLLPHYMAVHGIHPGSELMRAIDSHNRIPGNKAKLELPINPPSPKDFRLLYSKHPWHPPEGFVEKVQRLIDEVKAEQEGRPAQAAEV